MRADTVIAIPTPKKGAVYSDDITTAGRVYKTPSDWKGKKVRICVYTGAMDIQFHSTITTGVVYGQNSAFATATGVLTVNNNTGGHIRADSWEEYDIESAIGDDIDAYFSTDTHGTASWVGFVVER